VTNEQIEQVIADLKEQVARKHRCAAEKYFHSLDSAAWIEAQRTIGAEMALTELGRRLRSADGLRPEWAERLDPVGDFELRPRIAPGRAEFPAPSRITKRRLA